MQTRRLLIAWVLVLGLARPALGNPGYLPPFLDRVPSAGDHWLYSTDAPEAPGTYRAEVVEVSAVPDGYRYLVEYDVDIEPGIHPPPSRIEWFLLADGSIWRGSAWRGGALTDGPGKMPDPHSEEVETWRRATS